MLLLGPSGSGKSTLLNVLSGIVPNLIDLPMKYDELEIDPHSGVIFQDPDTQFCMPKVYEELAFVLENKQVPQHEMNAQIEAALNSVDLKVTDQTFVNHLSGGMKQKACDRRNNPSRCKYTIFRRTNCDARCRSNCRTME